MIVHFISPARSNLLAAIGIALDQNAGMRVDEVIKSNGASSSRR